MLNNGKGILFSPAEEWRVERKKKTHKLNQKYNSLDEYDPEARREVLREILGELNENVTFQGPVTFHYGVNTKVGKCTFVNFNFTCQDDGDVVIGEHCDFGPNVTILTPVHPQTLLCPARTHRGQLLDMRERDHTAGRYYRRRLCNWRGKCRHSFHTCTFLRGRQSVSCDSRDNGSGFDEVQAGNSRRLRSYRVTI